MPIVTITLQAGRPVTQTRQLLDTLHAALASTLGISERNRNQRLIEIQPEHYFYPAGRSANFMTVEIASFPGRTEPVKAALFRQICDNLQATLGIAKEDVMILIHEPAFENWGINGQPAHRPQQR